MSNALRELADLLRDSNVQVRFGLRSQGHIPTIKKMLKEGATWEQIGKRIGWDPKTAEEWYARERTRTP